MAKKETSKPKGGAKPAKGSAAKPKQSKPDKAVAGTPAKTKDYLVVEAATSHAALLIERSSIADKIKSKKKELDKLKACLAEVDDRIEHQGQNLMIAYKPSGQHRPLPLEPAESATPALEAVANEVVEQQQNQSVKFELTDGATWSSTYYESDGKFHSVSSVLTTKEGDGVAKQVVPKIPGAHSRIDDVVARSIDRTIEKVWGHREKPAIKAAIDDLNAKRRGLEGYESSPDYSPAKG